MVAICKLDQTISLTMGRTCMRLIQYSFVLCLVFFINSCGLVNTVYQNAPEVMGWWLDDYFDFTSTQEATLKPALQQVHQWHRQQQLPQYVMLLEETQRTFSNDKVDPSEVCNKLDTIKASISDLQLAFVPTIRELAPTLTDKQMTYLQTKLEQRTQKWKSEWWPETREEQVEVRLEKIEDYAEKFYGDLSSAQIAFIKQQLDQFAVQPEMTYQEVVRRNEDVLQTLHALRNPKLTEAEQNQLISDGFKRLQNSPNSSYQAYASQMNRYTCKVISALHATASIEQKQHANEWFKQHISQLNALALSKSNTASKLVPFKSK
jgi:Family of unknown function (DUF6279)